MSETCNDHSGICANMENIRREITEVRQENHENKAWIRLENEKTDNKIAKLGVDFNKKVDDGLNEIKTMIKEIETSKKASRWAVISNFILPSIVGVLLIIATKYIN